MRQASRIAINRTVAGVHYPVDSAAGAVLGLTLAKFLQMVCSDGDSYVSSGFAGRHFDPTQDFEWGMLYDPAEDLQCPQVSNNPDFGNYAMAQSNPADPGAMKSASLNWLWKKAVKEWKNLELQA